MRAVRHEGEVAKVKVGQQHTYNCSSKVALKRLRFIGAYDTTGVHDSAVECFIRGRVITICFGVFPAHHGAF